MPVDHRTLNVARDKMEDALAMLTEERVRLDGDRLYKLTGTINIITFEYDGRLQGHLSKPHHRP